jgi:hypothetical protein
MVAAAAVMMLTAVAACRADRDEERLPSVDAAGACPSDEDLARLNPDVDGSIRSQQARTGSPVRPDVPLWRTARLTGPQVEKTPSDYDDDIVVMAGAKLGATGPALVRRVRDGACGWMDVKDLERSALPMKLASLPGFGNTGYPARLDARVLVRSRIDPQTGGPRRAPVFYAPFDGPEPPEAEAPGHVSAFEVLSVFEVRRAEGARCRTLSEAGCFAKVGTADAGRIRSGAQGTRTRGWMLGQDLMVWPSPLAVYYKPGAEGVKIHATGASARNGTPYADPDAETRTLASQPPGRFAEPRSINIMRFPVLGGVPAGPPAARPDEPAATPWVYEIAFRRPACAVSDSGCLSGPTAQQGFVLQDGAGGDFRYWLGLRRPEFLNIRASVRELCESLPLGMEEVEDATLRLIKLLTVVDPEPGQNLRDHLSRALGLPADHLSTVFTGTADQFVQRASRSGERPAIVARVCRSAKLFDMAGDGLIVDDPAQDIIVATEGADTGRTSFRPGARPRTFDWRWTSPDTRSQWFFIPMDYLP